MRTSPLPGLMKKGCGCGSNCKCSTEGYKRNSPDVNKKKNIIASGNITMKGVDFKVRGTDNLGNTKIMQPGKDYKFPGNKVTETKYKK
tara:strand:- start:637 stop:900 length:264 start_codon:yes stop_codon:yes gene_type:complete